MLSTQKYYLYLNNKLYRIIDFKNKYIKFTIR